MSVLYKMQESVEHMIDETLKSAEITADMAIFRISNVHFINLKEVLMNKFNLIYHIDYKNLNTRNINIYYFVPI